MFPILEAIEAGTLVSFINKYLLNNPSIYTFCTTTESSVYEEHDTDVSSMSTTTSDVSSIQQIHT